MARPKGFTLSRKSLLYVLTQERLTMSEAAQQCGVPLTTLSGLAARNHGASMKTVRLVSNGLGVEPEVLFPALELLEVESPAAVA